MGGLPQERQNAGRVTLTAPRTSPARGCWHQAHLMSRNPLHMVMVLQIETSAQARSVHSTAQHVHNIL